MIEEGKYLQQLKERMVARGYAHRTQQVYLRSVKAFIDFHGGRDPRYMGIVEIELFMNYLSRQKGVLFHEKQKMFQALLFFYTEVLHLSLQKEYIDASRSAVSHRPVNHVGRRMVQRVMVF